MKCVITISSYDDWMNNGEKTFASGSNINMTKCIQMARWISRVYFLCSNQHMTDYKCMENLKYMK